MPSDTPHPAPPALTAARLWRPETLAAHLGVGMQTLSNWRCRRVGPPFVRLSRGAVRYEPAAVEAWKAARVVATAKPIGAEDCR